MSGDAGSRSIVAAVIGLGRSLGLTTVAEGVEERETVALLDELGCDLGQGWLFGRPMPEAAIGDYLRELVVVGPDRIADDAGVYAEPCPANAVPMPCGIALPLVTSQVDALAARSFR